MREGPSRWEDIHWTWYLCRFCTFTEGCLFLIQFMASIRILNSVRVRRVREEEGLEMHLVNVSSHSTIADGKEGGRLDRRGAAG